MQPTSLSAVPTPFVHPNGPGDPTRLAASHTQSCSDRVLRAIADYNSVMEEVDESMSASAPGNSTTRLRHGMSRTTAVLAIEQMVACTPNSLADLSVKQAGLDGSRVFCTDNPWLEHLINESVSRDLAHLSKPRKSSPSWFPYVAFPSWSPRPWVKARAPSETASRS